MHKDTSAMSVAQVLLVGAQEKMAKNKAELVSILEILSSLRPKNLAI